MAVGTRERGYGRRWGHEGVFVLILRYNVLTMSEWIPTIGPDFLRVVRSTKGQTTWGQ